MTKGTIVIDEVILPIADIWIDKGMLWIYAEATGPIRAVEPNQAYRVFGRDGQELVCSDLKTNISWPDVKSGNTLQFTCSWDLVLTHSSEEL